MQKMTKTKRMLLILSIVAIIVIVAIVAMRYYERKSIANAVASVNSLFVEKGINQGVTIEEDTKDDYNSFLVVYSPSAIKLIYASPIHGRYDFIVSGGHIRPFIITLRDGGRQKEYWIHRRGIENAMKLIGNG